MLDEHLDVKAIYPIHMNPIIRESANEILGNDDRIHIIEPLDVLDFHNFLRHSSVSYTHLDVYKRQAGRQYRCHYHE